MRQIVKIALHAGLPLVLIAAVVFVAQPAGAQAPEWSVDPAAYASTMSITAAAYSGSDRLASENDRLAAFVGEEIRGVANGTIVGSETLFFLTAYANDAAETLTFRLYDSRADQVVDVTETVTFVADAAIGNASNPKVLNVVGGPTDNRPLWSVDPAAYGSTMSVIAELFINGQTGGDDASLVAAFVGNEVRGVTEPILVGGRWLFFLTVYANASGETVTFKAYEASQDAVVDVDEEIVFAADAVVGSTSLPFALHAGSSSGANRPDWSVDPTIHESTMSVVAALYTSGVRSNRSADLVAAFVNGELRGVASPTSVSGQNVFFLTVHGAASDGTITFQAYDSALDAVADLAEGTTFVPDAIRGSVSQPFVLSTTPDNGSGQNAPNWSVDAAAFGMTMNVIGSLVIDGVANSHAGSRVAAFVGEEVRGVAAPLIVGGRTLYFLTIYANGVGGEISFRAYDAVADRLRGIKPPLMFQGDALLGSTTDPYTWKTSKGLMEPTWIPDSTSFALEMTVIGRLLINDEASTHPDNIVAAFAGSELRGVATPKVVDERLVYPMTVYANSDGETIRFEAYDAASDRIRQVTETITFASGTTTGSPIDPFTLTTSVDAPQAAPALLSPADGAIDVQLDPTLVWEGIPRATAYEAELATSEDFATATTFSNLTSTSLALTEPLSLSTTYFWRVRGVNAGGPGPWSETRRFTTMRPSVGTEDDSADLPDTFGLDQNYPNPFNVSTQIRYQLAETEHVRIVVHDLLGRTLTTLVDDVHSAGRYSIGFDGTGLSSGLYIYRLEAGPFSVTRAMTLVN